MPNNRVPFGLCKKYHIGLPDDATPRDAWNALREGVGITPDKAYAKLTSGTKDFASGKSASETSEAITKVNVSAKIKGEANIEAAEKLYDDIKSGKRYSYDELLENPVVKEFETKAQEATRLAEEKPPLSDKDKEKYGEQFLENAKSVPKQFRADIVMGLPAAGKSSAVVNSLKEKYGSFEFDNDEIKKLLPGYDEYGASYVHKDSKAVQQYAMKAFEKDGALNGANLAIPIIGDKIDKLDGWIKNLQSAGYDVHVHHVGISNNESMNRAVGRAIETGRHIPLSTIANYGEKPKEVYEQLKKEGRKEVTFDD